jgi:hypothetical protein
MAAERGDAVLYMRAVLDMSQPEAAIENLAKKASDPVTFGSNGSGTSGRSPSASPAERQAKAAEASIDRQMAAHAIGGGVNEDGSLKRARAFDYAARQGFSDWISKDELAIASRARNQPMWSPFLSSGETPAFDFPRGPERERLRQGPGFTQDLSDVQMGRSPSERRTQDRAFRKWQRENRGAGRDTLPGPLRRFDNTRDITQSMSDEPQRSQYDEDFMSNLGEAAEMEKDESRVIPGQNFPMGRKTPRDLFPTFRKFLRKGDGNNGMSAFYKRFLIMEALRSAGQMMTIGSEYAGGLAATGGSPLAMAQYGFQQTSAVASAIPFIGGIVMGAAKSISGTSTAIGMAQLAQMGDQGGAARLAISNARLGIHEQAGVATARGEGRDEASIQADLASSLRSARDRETSESAENTKTAEREKARLAAGHQGAGLRESIMDDLGYYDDQYAAVDAGVNASRRNAGGRRRQEEADAQAVAAARTRDLNIAIGISGYQSSAAGGLALQQARGRMQPVSDSQFFDPRYQAAAQIQQLQFANQQANSQQDVAYNTLVAQGRSKEADAIRPGQMQDRQARDMTTQQMARQINAQTDREIVTMKIGLNETSASLRARLSRNPYESLEAGYQADLSRSRLLPFDQQKQAGENAKMQRDAGLQEISDRQHALGGQQALALGVSGIMAQAVGPGADMMRRRAQVMGIAGGAELNAQSILRDSSLGDERQRLGFANNARQLGINQLQGERANYLQNFRSVSRGRNEIAAGNQDSARPEAVMRQLDDGIRSLRGNMGNGDITGAKQHGGDSTPNLLQQILAALTTGGALRAQ